MEKLTGTKCGCGYIHKQKIFQSLMILLFIAIGIGLFLIGLAITGTRANVFTVLGILMVLPGAKRVIALVVMLPYRSVEQERFDKIKEMVSEDAVLLTDYVFTSTEKIMHLDFVIVDQGNIIGVKDAKKKNAEYMQEYLQKGVSAVATSYNVKLCDSDKEMKQFYDRMLSSKKEVGLSEEEKKRQEAVVSYLKVLAV